MTSVSFENISYRPLQERTKSASCLDVKTKRAWLSAASTLCIVGAIATGAMAATGQLYLLAAAIPLAIGGTALALFANSLIDYNNPAELTKVRASCARMPLAKIIQKHGLERLFRYQLLTPDEFQSAFRKHAETLSFHDLLIFHADCTKAAGSCPIPALNEWKHKLIAETDGLNFRPLVANYPLQALIRHGVITSEELARSFSSCAPTLSLPLIVEGYEKTTALIAASGVPGYSIPAPSQWKEKFRQETRGLAVAEIVTSYKVRHEQLLKYEIISSEEYAVLEQAQQALNLFSRQSEEYRQELEKRTEKPRKACEKAKQDAYQVYQANPAHALLANLEAHYTTETGNLERMARIQIGAEESGVASYEKFLASRSQPAGEEELRHLAELKRRAETTIFRIRQQLSIQKSDLESYYKKTKDAHLESLRDADRLRIEACALADRQYEADTQPARDEVRAALAQRQAALNETLEKANQEYGQFQLLALAPHPEAVQASGA